MRSLYCIVLDVPADVGSGYGLFETIHDAPNAQVFADQLREAVQQYYGTAARAFLTELIKDRAGATSEVTAFRNKFLATYVKDDSDGQVFRAASRFALIGAAGALATSYGITGWPEFEAERAAKACFFAWLERRGHRGPAEIADGVEAVRRFFQLHGDARFEDPTHDTEDKDGNIHHLVVRERAGFKKDGYFYVYPEIFRHEVCQGYDWREIAKALIERGLLLPASDGRSFQRKVRDLDGNSVRMFCFTEHITGDADDSASDAANGKPDQSGNRLGGDNSNIN
jgi:putative DNA primase/helicase